MAKYDKATRYNFIMTKATELPTLPSIVGEVARMINDPLASLRQVEEAISKDQSLTVKTLKLANSAFYAIPGGAQNLRRAITFLGMETLYQLVLSASVFSNLDIKDSSGFDVKQLWRHSLGVGVAAEAVAGQLGMGDSQLMFISGLVHDMGKVLLYKFMREEFQATLAFAKDKNVSFHKAERETDALEHTVCGAMLAEQWKLPPTLQYAIRYHHILDRQQRTGLSPEANQSVDIICLANILVHQLNFGNSGYTSEPELPASLLEHLLIDQGKIADLVTLTKEKLAKSENLLSALMG